MSSDQSFQKEVFDSIKKFDGQTNVKIAENALESLNEACKSLEDAKKDQSQGLKSTVTDINSAAEAVRLGEFNLSDQDGPVPKIVPKNRPVDFYFQVMDQTQLENILEESVGKLIEEMKDSRQRNEATATEGSESEEIEESEESEEGEESEDESMDCEPGQIENQNRENEDVEMLD